MAEKFFEPEILVRAAAPNALVEQAQGLAYGPPQATADPVLDAANRITHGHPETFFGRHTNDDSSLDDLSKQLQDLQQPKTKATHTPPAPPSPKVDTSKPEEPPKDQPAVHLTAKQHLMLGVGEEILGVGLTFGSSAIAGWIKQPTVAEIARRVVIGIGTPLMAKGVNDFYEAYKHWNDPEPHSD